MEEVRCRTLMYRSILYVYSRMLTYSLGGGPLSDADVQMYADVC
jgi:hypothetical protein